MERVREGKKARRLSHQITVASGQALLIVRSQNSSLPFGVKGFCGKRHLDFRMERQDSGEIRNCREIWTSQEDGVEGRVLYSGWPLPCSLSATVCAQMPPDILTSSLVSSTVFGERESVRSGHVTAQWLPSWSPHPDYFPQYPQPFLLLIQGFVNS